MKQTTAIYEKSHIPGYYTWGFQSWGGQKIDFFDKNHQNFAIF